jgi:hypothetical protein
MANAFEVELHSTDPSAVEATRATLKQAPICAELRKAGDAWFVVGSDFARFACKQQGYVKRVLSPSVPEEVINWNAR